MAERRRRIGAYGVCRDEQGRVLLVRASDRSVRPGTWFLPGGGVDHGEAPGAAVVREVAEETGLVVKIAALRDVAAEVVARPPGLEHTDGVIYDLAVAGGELRPEIDGSSDLAAWVEPEQLSRWPLSQLAARALALPVPTAAGAASAAATGPVAGPAGTGAGPAGTGAGPEAAPRVIAPRPARGQRFGVYGIATDPAGRVLLTRISDGYPGAGRWHLPGGGTDFGEQPADGLLREITEETGQVGEINRLLAVTDQHTPAARGPEGYPIDWHAVRAVFEVVVPDPTAARVLDAGGSTAEARWLARDEAAALPLTDITAAMLGHTGGNR